LDCASIPFNEVAKAVVSLPPLASLISSLLNVSRNISGRGNCSSVFYWVLDPEDQHDAARTRKRRVRRSDQIFRSDFLRCRLRNGEMTSMSNCFPILVRGTKTHTDDCHIA
jgi:hypothetical protein